MLDNVRLKLEMNNAIDWIKKYIENTGAKGVIIR